MGESVINHKELLKKYIEHVLTCEGYSFISDIQSYEGFSDEEIKELELLELEIK